MILNSVGFLSNNKFRPSPWTAQGKRRVTEEVARFGRHGIRPGDVKLKMGDGGGDGVCVERKGGG